MELAIAPVEWALATVVVIAGTVLQGSLGFGVALVGAPLLYLVDPVLVPGPMIVAGMAVPVLLVWRERRGVVAGEVVRVLPGMVLGIALAAVVLRVISADALGLLFGGLVLLAVVLSLLGRPLAPGWRTLFVAGGLSGFMATTTSIGGPPLALAFQHAGGTRLRGTLSACFVPGALLSLLALHSSGHLGARELALGVSLLPGVVLGFWVSAYTARALDRHWLRGAVLAVSALAAVAAIVRALF
ncbi:MAG: sulfite exporter TauE/SafE family protein [Halofilum sp. (in: g-proteobacteria)]|nr:sulfite exporter TauE/SafE family protein [Halofilum sp. (in: g-proteobacteria)]